MLFEKYDQEADQLVRGSANADDLGDGLTSLLMARWKWLWRLIQMSRCYAEQCCVDVRAAIPPPARYGGVLMLSTTDTAQELNDPSGYPVKWNSPQIDEGHEFYHAASGPVQSRAHTLTTGLTRIYALLTYKSITADVSIAISIRVNGMTVLPGVGRHGYIEAAGGVHLSSSSSIETWAMLDANDYVEVIATANGAAGSVIPLGGECLLIMERKPQS